MMLEGDFAQSREPLPPVGYQVEPFQISNRDAYLRWTNDIWPKVTTLFNTEWKGLAESHADFYQKVLQKENGAVLLLKNQGTIIGVSFVYPIEDYKRSKDEIFYPKDRKTAYNSSVIVDPTYRGRGLVMPLIDETIQEASNLGYDYMVGHYNARVGLMPDGRFVEKGFAHRLKENVWRNGEIIPRFTRALSSHSASGQAEPVENIVFQLNRPQSQEIMLPLRRAPFSAMAVA